MSLTIKQAKELNQLGFRRAEYEDEVYPTDIFEFKGERWSIGGRILPNGNLICNEEIYKCGVWIPTISDLLSWLEDNNCTYDIKYNGQGYKIEIVDSNKKVFIGKAGTIEYAAFNVIIMILKEYGGNIVNRSYKVIEAEIIKED